MTSRGHGPYGHPVMYIVTTSDPAVVPTVLSGLPPHHGLGSSSHGTKVVRTRGHLGRLALKGRKTLWSSPPAAEAVENRPRRAGRPA